MDHKEDRAFMRQFSGVIAAFIVLTIVLIFVARGMQPEPEENGDSSKAVLAKERIAPVGAVRSGDAGAEALAAAQAAAAEAAVPEEVVVDGPAVYGSLCSACHDSGVSDAPIKGSEQMAARLDEKGIDTLVSNAINGLNVMPPKGGNPGLTDEQVRAAVEFMVQ